MIPLTAMVECSVLAGSEADCFCFASRISVATVWNNNAYHFPKFGCQ